MENQKQISKNPNPEIIRYARLSLWKIVAIIVILGLVAGYCLAAYRAGSKGSSDLPGKNAPDTSNMASQTVSPCREVAPREFDCTDDATKEAVYRKAVNGGITWYDSLKTITASVTKYSRLDSCHNKKGAICLTAVGRDTRQGTTVACPYTLALGTLVEINGKTYRCEDRTARWVQSKFGPTFDIFTENHAEALAFGRKTMTVIVK